MGFPGDKQKELIILQRMFGIFAMIIFPNLWQKNYMKQTILSIFILLLPVKLLSQVSERIISLAPSLTKSIYYLDSDHLLVGRTSFCYTEKKDKSEIVATALTVNLEKVITLQPDLVLVTPITDPETIEMIKKAGIKVEVFDTTKSFDEICNQFERMGELLGKVDLAKEINLNSNEQVYKIKSSYFSDSPMNFFFQIGAKPLFTVLENTYMNDYITFSGGSNIAEGLKRGTLTREFVLSKDPDVIIIVTMGIIGEEEMTNWRNFPFLKAVKNNRIFLIDADTATMPNPIDFLSTLQLIHDKLKEN